jgi:hypothetical protein
MPKKKSYMNISNIIKEGVLDKIFDFIKNKKVKKLEKDFRNQPEIKKKIQRLNKLAFETEKSMEKYGYTWNPSKGGWVSKDGKVNVG